MQEDALAEAFRKLNVKLNEKFGAAQKGVEDEAADPENGAGLLCALKFDAWHERVEAAAAAASAARQAEAEAGERSPSRKVARTAGEP